MLSGFIGKRFKRQDEIGTPFCITIDFETQNDDCVTVQKDSMKQQRIAISKLGEFLKEKL